MRIELDEKELRERINLNRNRLLNDSYYTEVYASIMNGSRMLFR